jgi:hypothetical protein
MPNWIDRETKLDLLLTIRSIEERLHRTTADAAPASRLAMNLPAALEELDGLRQKVGDLTEE